MRKGKIQPWKTEASDRMKSLVTKYPVVAAADLSKMRSAQIHEMRKRLRGKVEMAVVKKTIARKAVDQLAKEKPRIADFLDSLSVAPIFLFTETDPFTLALTLDKNKVRVPAKGGDIATSEIVVPAGNTGIPPGPVIGEFGEVKIPTKIESGSIWVSKDTVVARKGDVISPKLASILARLGIKPMEAGLSLVAAYEGGKLYGQDILHIDLEKVKADLREAAAQALRIAVNSGFPTVESLPLIISKTYRSALSLAVEAGHLTPETAPLILGRAAAQARALAALTGVGEG
ncbi:MAG: 50S ribosomal protein L10 [Candidatus Bathyarchaeia archaeon]